MKKFFLLFLLSAIIAGIVTFPWVTKFANFTFGGGHPSIVIYRIWWEKYSREHSLGQDINPLLSAPQGAIFTGKADAPLLFWSASLLNRVFGNEVLVYNILLFLSFPLTFLAVYYLLFYLCKNNFVSIFFGLVFTFSPYRISHLTQFTLAATYFFPVSVLYLIKSFREEGILAKAVFAVFLFLTFVSDLYYGYFLLMFSALFIAAFVVLKLLKRSEIRKTVKNSLVFGLFIVIGFLAIAAVYRPLISEYLSGSSQLSLKTTMNDLIMDTARPWDYLIPSLRNPILGNLGERLYGFVRGLNTNYWFSLPVSRENQIFLGYIPVFFFLIGIIYSVKRRSNILVPVLLVIIGFMFVASLPPDIYLGKSNEIHKVLLSYRLHEKLPMYRSYVRLGIFILLGILMIASLGLSRVLIRLRPKAKWLLCLAIIFTSGLEFFTLPGQDLSFINYVPEAYKYVARLPGDIIIAETPVEYYYGNCPICLNYQRYHGKKVFGPKMTYYFDYFLVKENIDDYAYGGHTGFLTKRVFDKMRHAGVKYLVFPTNASHLINDPSSLGVDAPNLLKEIKRDRDYSVFEVI